MELTWPVGILLVIAVGAIAVAWYGIAARIVRKNTRESLARATGDATAMQLMSLAYGSHQDGRVRQATSEIDAEELRRSIEKIRTED
ncbi:MAG: hypothetical protein N2037_10315 [Acidimicrobiales bacterium]|nr:hypothetical protein [Acidimicrobiales bacterium]